MPVPYADRLVNLGIPWELAQLIVQDSPVNFRNLLDGGDMTSNPLQRNIGGLASGGVLSASISNTPGYFADRWFGVGGASSGIIFSVVADTTVPGFTQSLTFGRVSANANTAVINMGQIGETPDAARCQGQPVVFSFWVRQGANYSGGNLTVQVGTGTGTNQSAANFVSGSWTNQATIINASIAVPTTMTRFQFTGNVGGTATQFGVLFSYTPSGTAGAADNVILNGMQLEIGTMASQFEHRDLEVELGICQRYCAVFAEPAAGVVVSGAGMINGTNAQQITIPLPTTMYKAPTVTVSAGSWRFNIAGVATAAAGIAAGSTHTPTMITIVGTTTATAGQGTALQGNGGTGYIVASSDF